MDEMSNSKFICPLHVLGAIDSQYFRRVLELSNLNYQEMMPSHDLEQLIPDTWSSKYRRVRDPTWRPLLATSPEPLFS